ncbi:MAG: hypothetical protein H0T73_02190 [Ardenticatenales bacterium]|nr:hypothetical protein [Ardenticatenales bacterium]
MKNNKSCPKCQSKDIIRVTSNQNTVLSIGWFRAVAITRYVCAPCGYTEEWIESASDIEKLRRQYKQV